MDKATHEYIYDNYTFYIAPYDKNKELKSCTDISLLTKEKRIYDKYFSKSNNVIRIYDMVDDYIIQDKITTLDRFYDKVTIKLLINLFELLRSLNDKGLYFTSDIFYSVYVVKDKLLLSDLYLLDEEDRNNKSTKCCVVLLETLYSIRYNASSIDDLITYLSSLKLYKNIVRNSYLDNLYKLDMLENMKVRWNKKKLILRDINISKYMLTKDTDLVVHGYTTSNGDLDTYIDTIKDNMNIEDNKVTTLDEVIRYVKRKSKIVRYTVLDICEANISKDPKKIQIHFELCYFLYKLFIDYYSKLSKEVGVIVLPHQISIDADYKEIIITSYEISDDLTEMGVINMCLDIFKTFMKSYKSNELYNNVVNKKYGKLSDLVKYIDRLDYKSYTAEE